MRNDAPSTVNTRQMTTVEKLELAERGLVMRREGCTWPEVTQKTGLSARVMKRILGERYEEEMLEENRVLPELRESALRIHREAGRQMMEHLEAGTYKPKELISVY